MADIKRKLPAFYMCIKKFVSSDTRNFNMYVHIFGQAYVQLVKSGVGEYGEGRLRVLVGVYRCWIDGAALDAGNFGGAV